jgi:hypothetical protein
MEPQYTAGEHARRAALGARGCVRILRGRSTGRVETALDRLEAKVADRTERDRRAALTAYDRALDDVATAKNAERRARGDDKQAAREERRKAERRRDDAKREARKYL